MRDRELGIRGCVSGRATEHLLDDPCAALGIPDSLLHHVASTQVQLVRRRVDLRSRLRARDADAQQPLAQRIPDGARDLVLHGEDVAHVAVVALRPELMSLRGVDELRRDAQARARLAYAAVEHEARAELLADAAHVQVAALECQRRRTRHHPKTGELGERVADLVGQPVAEVLVLHVRAQIRKGEHGDRALRLRR